MGYGPTWDEAASVADNAAKEAVRRGPAMRLPYEREASSELTVA